MIIGICAVDEGGGIGAKGGLPWGHNKYDMKFFRLLTEGHSVVMGRVTWDSLPVKPLPKRENIILSKSSGIKVINSEDYEGVLYGKEGDLKNLSDKSNMFVIGGASIFSLYEGMYDAFIISNISGVNDCDTFFPYDVIGEMVEVSVDSIRGKDNKLHIDLYVSEDILGTHKEFDLHESVSNIALLATM